MLDPDKIIALPCLIVGKPFYETADGYKVFNAILNKQSNLFINAEKAIPASWIKNPAKFSNSTPPKFTVCINCEQRLWEDISYVFVGEIASHKTYGLQFKATSVCMDDQANAGTMRQYLTRMPNIGPKRSAIILSMFEFDEIEDVLENKVELLEAVPGITHDRALGIRQQWLKDKNIRKIYFWILSHEIPPVYGGKIIEEFGDQAISILEKNPYELTKIYGVGFLKADDIAYKILNEVPKDFRTKSCLRYLLLEEMSNGHVCYPLSDLETKTNEMLILRNNEDHSQYIKASLKTDFIIVGDTKERSCYCYLPEIFRDEKKCADFLTLMRNFKSDGECAEKDIQDAQDEYNLYYGSTLGRKEIQFDIKQREAISSAFTNKMTVITGGGGTGKSSICRAICSIANKYSKSVFLLAPTGQAAKILSRKTECEASTIHRGLGLIPRGGYGCIYGPRGKVEVVSDILIIDEFSMVGLDTLPFIFDSIRDPEKTNIVFVGDPQQLPSVFAGNNLHDIILSGCANVVKLSNIYRQSENSHISFIANQISGGRNPVIPEKSDDFHWYDAFSCEDAVDHFKKLLEKFIEEESLKETHVLCSIYDRGCGVNLINKIFQERYTSQNKSLTHSFKVFNVGDRVMHLVNNYDKGVFNGNVGYIIDLGIKVMDPSKSDQPSTYITVKLEDDSRVINYVADEISELAVAWCTTVHKFQGSQMKNVVFFMVDDHRSMMSKELVYTAMTRAESHLYVIGSDAMINRSIQRSVIFDRYTSLQKMIINNAETQPRLKFLIPESFKNSDS